MKKFEELLVNKGLYDSINVTVDDLEEMEQLLSDSFINGYNVECFCVGCNEKSVFESEDKEVHEEHGFTQIAIDAGIEKARKPKKESIFQQYLNKRYSISFRCTRTRDGSVNSSLQNHSDKNGSSGR